MASTRAKNAPMTYACWKASNDRAQQYTLLAAQTTPNTVAHPGLGLVGSKMPSFALASNSTDLESALRGLGSSGLEISKLEPHDGRYDHPSQNIHKQTTVYLPDPLVVQPDPRFTIFGGNSDR